MKTIALLLLAMLFLLAFVPSEVRADGITIRIESNSFALHDETAQVGAINYENGREKLLLAVKLGELTSSPLVWIVPVPASASEVKVDVCQEFPQFYGEDVLQEAERDKEVVGEVASYVAMTQILPGIFLPNFGRFLGTEAPERVQVYAHVEKEGITAEVVSAETGGVLDEYLQRKRLAVPAGSIPVIDEYIGKSYSFVISWVESRLTEGRDVTPAILWTSPPISSTIP